MAAPGVLEFLRQRESGTLRRQGGQPPFRPSPRRLVTTFEKLVPLLERATPPYRAMHPGWYRTTAETVSSLFLVLWPKRGSGPRDTRLVLEEHEHSVDMDLEAKFAMPLVASPVSVWAKDHGGEHMTINAFFIDVGRGMDVTMMDNERHLFRIYPDGSTGEMKLAAPFIERVRRSFPEPKDTFSIVMTFDDCDVYAYELLDPVQNREFEIIQANIASIHQVFRSSRIFSSFKQYGSTYESIISRMYNLVWTVDAAPDTRSNRWYESRAIELLREYLKEADRLAGVIPPYAGARPPT